MSRNERKQTSKQEIKKGRKKANKQERTQRKKIQDIRSNVAIPLEINKGTVAGRPKAIGYISATVPQAEVRGLVLQKSLVSRDSGFRPLG